MQLKLARHLWGVDLTWEAAFPKFREDGYVMIETRLPEPQEEARFLSLLKQYDFGYIAMGFTEGATPAEHAVSFRKQLERGTKIGAAQMTFHSGSDAWSITDSQAFYKEVVAIEKDFPIAVGHETHRGRVFYNPWTTRDLLQQFEPLKLCCDLSHWTCVAERLGFDDANGTILKLCAERAVHIHARVGYEEGPQVPDPSAPEYARQLEQFLTWWDALFAGQKARGLKTSTVTPEFGPPNYLHTLPHTNVPVADLWKVCNWTAAKVKERFRG